MGFYKNSIVFLRINSALLLLLIYSCRTSQTDSFEEWFANQNFTIAATENPLYNCFNIQSAPLYIDTIYRSMQGPYDNKQITIGDSQEKLIWLTGYEVKLVNSKTSDKVSDGFMCHNNLEIVNKNEFPWKVKTQGTNIRLFTLTEGQIKVKFPEGFGIPIPADQLLIVNSQVLNHNISDIDISIKHDIRIEYLNQSKLKQPLIPLYQQAVFVVKQTSGPEGEYGVPSSCNTDSIGWTAKKENGKNEECCIPSFSGDYNPYKDDYNRTYTGHWPLPLKTEVLKTDVTNMLDLPFDTRIHYIGVHMHPFAVSIELRDATIDSSLYTARIVGHENQIGIKSIESYSSEIGIPVYKNHCYQLVSTYQYNDSAAIHTAMAMMFLYLRDK